MESVGVGWNMEITGYLRYYLLAGAFSFEKRISRGEIIEPRTGGPY